MTQREHSVTNASPHPNDPGVHSTKQTVPLINDLLHFRNIVNQPVQLESTKVRVDGQATLGLEEEKEVELEREE